MKTIAALTLTLGSLFLTDIAQAAHPLTVTVMEKTPDNTPGARIPGAIVIVMNAQTGQQLMATTSNINGVANIMGETQTMIKIRVVKGGPNGYLPAERVYFVPSYNANVNIQMEKPKLLVPRPVKVQPNKKQKLQKGKFLKRQ